MVFHLQDTSMDVDQTSPEEIIRTDTRLETCEIPGESRHVTTRKGFDRLVTRVESIVWSIDQVLNQWLGSLPKQIIEMAKHLLWLGEGHRACTSVESTRQHPYDPYQWIYGEATKIGWLWLVCKQLDYSLWRYNYGKWLINQLLSRAPTLYGPMVLSTNYLNGTESIVPNHEGLYTLCYTKTYL